MSADTVSDDEIVIRHIPAGVHWQVPPTGRASSANFQLRPGIGETGLSVSRTARTTPEAMMARLGDPAAGSKVAAAPVSALRALGLEVVPDPIPEDPGHALIVDATASLNNRRLRQHLAALFEYVLPLPADQPPDTPAGS
jgi:hypothetical protein